MKKISGWRAVHCLLLLSLAICLPAHVVLGYEEVSVTSLATLSGKVTLKGAVPATRIFHLVFSPNIAFCSRVSDGKGNRLLKEFRVASDGGFQDVVVAVVGVEKGKPFNFVPQIDIEDCRMLPFVTPVRNQYPIALVNHDPVHHDIQGYTLKENYTFPMFNKPLVPAANSSAKIRMRDGHYIFRTQCGVHDFMQSWGIAVGNPYFAVTGKDGQFDISDIPAGEYDLIAWHPYLKIETQRIKVGEQGKITANFEMDASFVEIPLYSTQKEYRLDTTLKIDQIVSPSVELQIE
jgi:hypothetical protein